MAASAGTANGPWRRIALVLVAYSLLLNDGAVCQDTTTSIPISESSATDPATHNGVIPSTAESGSIISAATAAANDILGDSQGTADSQSTAADSAGTIPSVTTTSDESNMITTGKSSANSETQAAKTTISSAGQMSLTTAMLTGVSKSDIASATPSSFDVTVLAKEGGDTEIMVESEPQENIRCVESVKDEDAVHVWLQESSSCENTKEKLQEVVGMLCGNDCKLELFQADSSDKLIVRGENVLAAPNTMAEMFKNEEIKNKLGVLDAQVSWGKRPPTVLVSLLLAGLFLLVALLGGYCFKMHRAHSSKGMRLAEESYHGDEENQANTLVSVAPLSQPEPQEKPNINGESPDSGKTQPPAAGTGSATTNGHSATKTPVADTEL
ncbi:hematopoietic progenitor cell antigen CD34-like [Scleropages formosus]|uniref:Hematopoietic progenitor cell antigen CD34-like n=1 Tax=Scleropages formosus TaxID=113540 RepID=A0A8C9S0J2_SCLFO|nr:hematopoietic progenitor cell antigen CD34-like [Scleropages formosus]